jgi:hypothetical protein
MATAFTRRGAALEQVSAAEVDKMHSKIGQFVVEQNFFGAIACMLACTRWQSMPRSNCSERKAKNGKQRSQAQRSPTMSVADIGAVQFVL